MKEFQIEITETLQIQVFIEAKNEQEAEIIAETNWTNGDYILDADCFLDVEFNCI